MSRNKIKSFDEVIYDYTNGSETIIINHRNSDISFSPSVISTLQVLVKPVKNMEAEFSAKYIGRQFLDNTSDLGRSLPAYHYENLRLSYNVKSKYSKTLSITFMINNLFDARYSSNGYSYSYIYGSLITENFLYPQAGRNLMLGIKIGL
ncbi:MAG: TonB-dependent receptor [Saprospiraceae bacterium]|nr:TonB-dependent receptor [Saprospiraceae bacterium]